MEIQKVKIELDEYEANEFVLFRKYYFQFNKMLEKGIFEKDFTGRVILDVMAGDVKNLQKIMSYHFQIKV